MSPHVMYFKYFYIIVAFVYVKANSKEINLYQVPGGLHLTQFNFSERNLKEKMSSEKKNLS